MGLDNLKLGICGVGMVGGALQRYFQKKSIQPFIYDKGKRLGSVEELNKADIVFVCVPTPFKKDNGGFDLSYIREAVNYLESGKIVVLKSTIVPGTTKAFQEKYPQHRFLFNPEFLREASPDHDMQYPERQIVGYTDQSQDVAQTIMNLLPDAPFEKILRAREAEMVKYFGNTFLATKVIFATQIYELCQKLGVDYEQVRECVGEDERIGKSHLDVLHDGYKGFGGSCFPKDMRAFIQFGDSKGVDLKLLKTAEAINNELMAEQEIEDPEKMSRKHF